MNLQSTAVLFDQALYAKATEIKWKHRELFKDLLRIDVFHTICTFFSVIGKCFQDTGLRDVIIESGVIAEGSIFGVLEGRTYNRAIRFHKLMYESLNRLAWMGFNSWTDQHHTKKDPLVDGFFQGLKVLCDKKPQWQVHHPEKYCNCSAHICTTSDKAWANSRSSGCPMVTW